MVRTVLRIDREKCNGCGLCAGACPEGALKIVDGKARLVGELLCDGLGACIGECPEGALTVEQREAEPYDERKVLDNILSQGPRVLLAHLEHLRDHGQHEYLAVAAEVLKERRIVTPQPARPAHAEAAGSAPCGCPGSRNAVFERPASSAPPATGTGIESALTHWPIQMHLLSPADPQYREADVVLAADCAAYALGDFHDRFLRGRTLAIACPKLDAGQDVYLRKLTALITDARIRSLTVVILEVPCCRGLLELARQAIAASGRQIPLEVAVVGIRGEVVREQPAHVGT